MRCYHYVHLLALLLCLLNVSLAENEQHRFTKPHSASQVTALTLSSLSFSEFTTLSHPRFPVHSVRIKRSNFCDPTVKVWSGYIDVDDGPKHLFFTFFESRNDPDTDDVVMWINGGPGCSSFTGLLMELGPCNIDMENKSANGTIWNPYSWNTNANIFFLDQPVGVGFSYADYGETVEITEDAAINIYAFVSIFFDTFKQFQGRGFHLSGESYAGKYLPVFAAEIYDRERKRTEGVPINLKSVIIGNGNTDISKIHKGRYDVVCSTASLDAPILDVTTCARMKRAVAGCQRLLVENCFDIYNDMLCKGAVDFCDSEISEPFWKTGLNVYDVSKKCLGDDLCYSEQSQIASYLNRPEIRDTLGVPPDIGKFTGCSDVVGFNFAKHMDKWRLPAQLYVAELLERGIPVLIYAGTYDWQCNWVSNFEWTNDLEWSGAKEFRAQTMRDWSLPNSKTAGGQTRSAKGLTMTTIYGAGHMVPHDKPAESLYMLQQWLARKDL